MAAFSFLCVPFLIVTMIIKAQSNFKSPTSLYIFLKFKCLMIFKDQRLWFVGSAKINNKLNTFFQNGRTRTQNQAFLRKMKVQHCGSKSCFSVSDIWNSHPASWPPKGLGSSNPPVCYLQHTQLVLQADSTTHLLCPWWLSQGLVINTMLGSPLEVKLCLHWETLLFSHSNRSQLLSMIRSIFGSQLLVKLHLQRWPLFMEIPMMPQSTKL